MTHVWTKSSDELLSKEENKDRFVKLILDMKGRNWRQFQPGSNTDIEKSKEK